MMKRIFSMEIINKMIIIFKKAANRLKNNRFSSYTRQDFNISSKFIKLIFLTTYIESTTCPTKDLKSQIKIRTICKNKLYNLKLMFEAKDENKSRNIRH